MIKSKWIRRALLGGVAMAVMASGAQAADDLEALKAQIEALQARVNAIEAKGVNLPEGVSLITFQRGAKEIKLSGDDTKAIDKASDSRGFTIAITPTADLPAPTTEITIGGEIRGVALWGKRKVGNLGQMWNGAAWVANRGVTSDKDFDLWARGTVNIRSRTDTAIGQIRTMVQIRASFADLDVLGDRVLADNNDPSATTPNVQARLAFGEWDFMPGWMLRVGHAAQIARIANAPYNTIAAPYGFDNSRHNQVLIQYSGGPLVLGLGIENPSTDDIAGTVNTTAVPDFAGYMQFNAPMGISLRVSGEIAKVGGRATNAGVSTTGLNTGYLIGVGTAFQAGIFSLNGGFIYTKGLGCDSIFSAGGTYCRVDGDGTNVWNAAGPRRANNAGLAKAYGFQVNGAANLTETVTANVSFGYFNYTNLANRTAAPLWDRGFSIGGNLVWRPVDAFQLGAEVDYFESKSNNFCANAACGATTTTKAKQIVAGVAAWFFF